MHNQQITIHLCSRIGNDLVILHFEQFTASEDDNEVAMRVPWEISRIHRAINREAELYLDELHIQEEDVG